jgi:hypothetical protein
MLVAPSDAPICKASYIEQNSIASVSDFTGLPESGNGSQSKAVCRKYGEDEDDN